MNLNTLNEQCRFNAVFSKQLVLFILMILFSATAAFAQTKTISGKVLADGEALFGASVVEKGTTNGTVTEMDGTFSLNVNSGAVLVISYLGYEDVSITVGNQTNLTIQLKEDANVLDEVVAIGYGVQQKKLVTGATVQVKGDQLVKQSAINPLGGLQGLTPGVSIVKNNGKPGEGYKVTIRGAGTMGETAPLYVIDGFAGGDINALNPSDIESIDILKDAASAAIYGARAANGVILVTTKQAKKGVTSISYDGYYGLQNIDNNIDMVGAKDYLTLLEESGMITIANLTTEQIPMLDQIMNGEWNGTNWLDKMLKKNAPMQNHALNINKGTESSAFTLGFSYTAQEPSIAISNAEMDAGYERYTARINSEHTLIKLKDRDLLKVGETMTLSFSNRKGLNQATSNTNWNDFRNAFKAMPIFQAYNEAGDFEKSVNLNSNETNPLARMYYNSFTQSKSYGARGVFYFILEPVKNLKWRSDFGVNYTGGSSRGYVPQYELNATSRTDYNSVNQSQNMGLKWQIENTLAYSFNVNKSHNFSALAGSTVERYGLSESISGSNQNMEFDDFYHAYLSNAKTIEQGRTGLSGSGGVEGGTVSFFGRVNYDYQNKYMATATMRADGSSNFARGHRWGYFPSISAGWNITEEVFMEDAKDVLDYLKIRASWGENGNNRIDNFRYLSTMSYPTKNGWLPGYYYFGEKTNSPTVGTFPEYISNDKLTWETSRQTNIGFDMMMLKNRLGINFDWYHKKTVDWLLQTNALGIWGTKGPWVNGGDIVNKGVEIMLNWNDKIGDFRYAVSANLGYNKNEVVRIANEDNYIDGNSGVLGSGTGIFYRAEVGKPLGYFIGYRTDGIFQNQAEIDNYVHPETGQQIMPGAKPGDVRFRDLTNDGQITVDDREMVGDPNPDFNYGINLSLEYKAFDVAVVGYGVAGNQIMKSYRLNTLPNWSNYPTEMLGRWHGEGTSNRLPALDGNAINWGYVSDLYVEDGDYFRITNITLGVDFKKIFKSLPLNQLRVYATGENLFTFTNYSGLDPEINSYSGAQSWTRGIDIGNYPVSRVFLIGVNIKY